MLIDLRSDTVTLPTPAMRKAMYQAELGDDVYGEDPNILRLQELAAERIGKEAALFVPSGTMGNFAAVLAHTRRGDAVLLGDQSHIYCYEAGGSSVLGGVLLRPIANQADGMLDLNALSMQLTDDSDAHVAPASLICIENTHNRCGGAVLQEQQLITIKEYAQRHGARVHMDGARIFNAAIALQVPVNHLTRHADSVMFCLSKGLSAPVGSLLVGTHEFIQRAHRIRKMLGGGMRQAGILAAAGIVALEQMVERLAEDHQTGQQLAQKLAAIPRIQIDPQCVKTNIVIFSILNQENQPLNEEQTQHFLTQAKAQGVLLGSVRTGYFRAVTHYGINMEHITEAVKKVEHILKSTI